MQTADRFCRACGSPRSASDRFCGSCRAEFAAGSPVDYSTSIERHSAARRALSSYRSHRWPLRLGLVLLVISATTAAASYAWFPPKQPDPVPPASQMLSVAKRSVATVHVVGGTLRAPEPGMFKGTGSGFFIDSHGHLLTSAHVINEAWKVTVLKADGTEHPARLVARDPAADVAELQVEGPNSSLSVSNATPVIHQRLYVLGNPHGVSPNTVSDGRVTRLKASLTIDGHAYSNAVITDADAEPGNSGGPVIDEWGRAIGILTGGSALRTESFFLPLGNFKADLGSWARNPSTTPFRSPDPNVQSTVHDFACEPDARCALTADFTNHGGPGRVAVIFCVNREPGTCGAGTGLASCSTWVELTISERRDAGCTAASPGLADALRAGQRVWSNVTMQTVEPALL
jgi:putative serine protease PepD